MLSCRPFLLPPIHSPFLLLRLTVPPRDSPTENLLLLSPRLFPFLRVATPLSRSPPSSMPCLAFPARPAENNGSSFDRSSGRGSRRQIELEICDSAVCKVVRLFLSSQLSQLLRNFSASSPFPLRFHAFSFSLLPPDRPASRSSGVFPSQIRRFLYWHASCRGSCEFRGNRYEKMEMAARLFQTKQFQLGDTVLHALQLSDGLVFSRLNVFPFFLLSLLWRLRS